MSIDSTRELCRVCHGNGVIKIQGGESVCPRCEGECYDPEGGSLQKWVLDNIYTIARRELNRLQPYVVPDTLAIERWGHVLRLCEKVGCQGRGVLRDNGGEV